MVDYDSQVLLIPVEMQFFHADLGNSGESPSTLSYNQIHNCPMLLLVVSKVITQRPSQCHQQLNDILYLKIY